MIHGRRRYTSRKQECSLLKKRTKKLLTVCGGASRTSTAPICKSFLLLFFKKEVLPSA
jgi:hypothetical protein